MTGRTNDNRRRSITRPSTSLRYVRDRLRAAAGDELLPTMTRALIRSEYPAFAIDVGECAHERVGFGVIDLAVEAILERTRIRRGT